MEEQKMDTQEANIQEIINASRQLTTEQAMLLATRDKIDEDKLTNEQKGHLKIAEINYEIDKQNEIVFTNIGSHLARRKYLAQKAIKRITRLMATRSALLKRMVKDGTSHGQEEE